MKLPPDIKAEADFTCTAESVHDDFGKYLSKMSHEVIAVLHEWMQSHRTQYKWRYSLYTFMDEAVEKEFQERMDDVQRAIEEADRDNRNQCMARKSEE